MTQALFCLLLLAQPQTDQDVEFRSRLAKTDPANGSALLSLGQWCEGKKRAGWAERCYRMVAGLGGNPSAARSGACVPGSGSAGL